MLPIAAIVCLCTLLLMPLTGRAGDGTSPSQAVTTRADLQMAINAANSGDVIYVRAVIDGGFTGDGIMLTFNASKSITLRSSSNGNPAYIDLIGSNRHFSISAAGTYGITFIDVQLKGRNPDASISANSGGGIYNPSGSKITLHGANTIAGFANVADCYLSGCVANEGEAVMLGNFKIDNCRAQNGYGAVYNSGTLTITDSVKITNNVLYVVGSGSNTGYGAGIYNSGTLNIYGKAEISGNKNTGNFSFGGGIYTSNICNIGTNDPEDSVVIAYNIAGSGCLGGGIWNSNGTLRISGKTLFIGNDHCGVISTDGLAIIEGAAKFIENVGPGIENGGNAYSGTMIIKDSVEISNNILSGVENNGNCTIQDKVRILNNHGHNFGGGGVRTGYYPSGAICLIKDDVLISGNSTSASFGNGGGVFNRATCTIQDRVRIIGNTGVWNLSSLIDYGNGGGVSNKDGNLTIKDKVEITDIISGFCGGGVHIEGGTVIIADSVLIARNNVLCHNGVASTTSYGATGGNGGGIYIAGSSNTTIQDKVRIINNTVDFNATSSGSDNISQSVTIGNGGGICQGSGTLNIKDNVLIANNEVKAYLGTVGYTGGGAAVYFGNGGGIYQAFSATTTITDSVKIENNIVAPTYTTLVNTRGNIACGGGIYHSGGPMTIQGNTQISNNNVPLSTGTYSSIEGGGGICSYSGTITLKENARVFNNRADKGGGIYLSATLSSGTRYLNIADSVQITNNSAVSGGGLYNGNTYAVINMTDNAQITCNNATANGGGIYHTGGASSTLTITDATIANNTATGHGGGIYNGGNSSLTANTITITDAIITGNTAGGDGGGIWTTFSNYGYNTIKTDGVVFDRNKAVKAVDWTVNGSHSGIFAPNYIAQILNTVSLSDISPYNLINQKATNNAYNNYDISYDGKPYVITVRYYTGTIDGSGNVTSKTPLALAPDQDPYLSTFYSGTFPIYYLKNNNLRDNSGTDWVDYYKPASYYSGVVYRNGALGVNNPAANNVTALLAGTGMNITRDTAFDVIYEREPIPCDLAPEIVLTSTDTQSCSTVSNVSILGNLLIGMPGIAIDTAYSNGKGTVTWTKLGSPFDITYIPSFPADSGKTITITVTTNIPSGTACIPDTARVRIKFNTPPKLTSNTLMSEICSGNMVHYTATADSVVTFSWTRVPKAGITSPGTGSGSGAAIDETLYNSTSSDLTVTYKITMTTLSSCAVTQDVLVTVKPKVKAEATIKIKK